VASPARPDPFLLAADLLDPRPDPYVRDPVGWVRDRLGERLWSKQVEIAESVRDNRYTAVHSCHDVGKSFVSSRIAAWWLDVHPPGDAFVVSTAPSFPQVRAILWKEIGRAHRKGDLRGRVNQTEWHIGTELVGMGRKPSDYDPHAFQGIHARYVLVVIDEACGIPKVLWDAADSLVTNEYSRILAIGNPDDPNAHFADVCAKGSGWHVIHIDGLESPNFTDERIPEELRPLLISPVWVDERKRRWGEDSPLYISKVRGLFPESGTDNLIPMAWIVQAQRRELNPGTPVEIGVDVAWFGDDETVIGVRRGRVVRTVESTRKQDSMKTTGRVVRALRATGAASVKLEVVSVGIGVYDRLGELGQPVAGLLPGQAASDVEQYADARSEWYWALRQRFEAGQIDIDPTDEDLAAQLGAIKYTVTSRGQIKVESKKTMKRRGLPSPDRADMVMLAFAKLPPADRIVTDAEQDQDEESISPV
jgi:hypothetical protein